MPPSSDILITYDGNDITNSVLFRTARFESQANALPGTFSFTVRDMGQTHSFTTGKEVYVYIDGIKLFGGIVLRVGRTLALPVVDTTTPEDVTARQWVIEGADFNIWFDKRVIRNPADYTHAIVTSGVHKDGVLIRDYLPDYIDVPPGVTIGAEVEDIADFGIMPAGTEDIGGAAYQWVTQGDTWRKQMDEFAARSGAVYYIDADKVLHYHALETVTMPWSFVDYNPNGVSRIGCREVTATQDGSVIVTDALVWGGLEVEGTLYFARYPDPPADDEREQNAIDALNTHGRWQLAERRFEEGNDQASVELRARTLIMGPPGLDPNGQAAGLRYPLWRISLSWFGHKVPSANHIKPGYLTNIMLYVMGTDLAHPLIQFLPLRRMDISFPQIKDDGTTWVKFTGEFGLSYSDSRFLWRYILRERRETVRVISGSVTDSSTSSSLGSYASLTPVESPDGTRQEFSMAFPLVSSTVRVYVNGLLWREGYEYSIIDETTINFFTPLAADDTVHVEGRTLQG